MGIGSGNAYFQKGKLMAANLTETAIRGLKTKSTAYYVEQQCSTWYWQAWRQGSAFRQQSFYFRYYVEKGKKEKFIQLGIWPEMKLVTANELAKSMVPGLLKEKSPSKSLSNSRPNSTSCRSIVLRIV